LDECAPEFGVSDMKRHRLAIPLCVGAAIGLLIPSIASAATSTSILVPFTGSDIEVELTLSDDLDDGRIRGHLEVVDGIGDLRGVFLNLSDSSLLGGLSVGGDDVTDFETGDSKNLGQGNNLNGGGSPCPCDIGVSFGSPGIGWDDIQQTMFIIYHQTEYLDLDLFIDQLAGVRVTSVGDDEYSGREGSSKLYGVVPEPSTAVLLMLGLLGLKTSKSRH
jgi:hypothetical protein